VREDCDDGLSDIVMQRGWFGGDWFTSLADKMRG